MPDWRKLNLMNTTLLPEKLLSKGLKLDSASESLGVLRDSNDLLDDAQALHQRMAEDGYLLIRNYLKREEVLAAREEITSRLAAEGLLDLNHPHVEAVAAKGPLNKGLRADLAKDNKPLQQLLYSGKMTEFYEHFLGGPIRHFDFTWMRAIAPGVVGTNPHADIVYMGRGTKQLYTAWTPLGDIDYAAGGLMVLEQSHLKGNRLKKYLEMDVDEYCTNHTSAKDIESGKKKHQWPGYLTNNPVSLQDKLSGRWLVGEYSMGDFMTFPMFTIHASLDNTSDRFRLSSDSRYQLASEPVDERWVGENPVGHGLAGKKGRIC